jgi:hypothetical protein
MRIKALDTFEHTRHVAEENDDGVVSLRPEKIVMKEGDIGNIEDKLAGRLIKHGIASEDMNAETKTQKMQREAAQQQD